MFIQISPWPVHNTACMLFVKHRRATLAAPACGVGWHFPVSKMGLQLGFWNVQSRAL